MTSPEIPQSPTAKERDGRSVNWKEDDARLLLEPDAFSSRTNRRRSWSPPFSAAFRYLLLLRSVAAFFSIISDCDETFQYWEPFHFLLSNLINHSTTIPWRPWEYSPAFAIRSWAYILLQTWPVLLLSRVVSLDKRMTFYLTRFLFVLTSTYAETLLFDSIRRHINVRIANYYLFLTSTSSAMFLASPAFLPSSTSMILTTFATAQTLRISRTDSQSSWRSTSLATIFFTLSASLAWPFASILALPFIFEQLFLASGDAVARTYHNRLYLRLKQLGFCACICVVVIVIPTALTDSFFYKAFEFVPWNIIRYNVFPADNRGPNLYGTDPVHWYFLNLGIRHQLVLPLALITAPLLILQHQVRIWTQRKTSTLSSHALQSTNLTLMLVRCSPVYIWIFVMSLQPHKEERFMYPIYTLVLLNAAISLYVATNVTQMMYAKYTSQYQAIHNRVITTLPILAMAICMTLGVMHTTTLIKGYRAPMLLLDHFRSRELPVLLNASGLLPPVKGYEDISAEELFKDPPRWDLTGLIGLRENVTICWGNEWYRLPSSFLIPDGVQSAFIPSHFGGALPGKWETDLRWNAFNHDSGLYNDLNQAIPQHLSSIDICTYMMHLMLPSRPADAELEPDYSLQRDVWEKLRCLPFLDTMASGKLDASLHVPAYLNTALRRQSRAVWGQYCLLGRANRSIKTARDSSPV